MKDNRMMLDAESLENVMAAYETGIKDCEKVIGEIDKELRQRWPR